MSFAPNFDDLRNARVLVTGASSGIGAAVALGFASCGAQVGVHYNENQAGAEAVVQKIAKTSGSGVVLQVDLADPSNHKRLADEAVQALGGLDILINNAGTIFSRKPIWEFDDNFYCQLFDLNVRSVMGLTKAVLPALEKSNMGNIITTTSVAVRTGGAQGTSIYAATKGALNSMTIGLAKELGPRGIRVNAVGPSLILTPLHDGRTDAATLEKIRVQVPLGRLGEADDCVGAYLFLASPGLAGYVSGITIEITGGRV